MSRLSYPLQISRIWVGFSSASPIVGNYFAIHTGAWRNSPARAALPVDVAAHMDAMESRALSDLVVCMERWCLSWSYDEVASALAEVLARTGGVRESDVEMMLARISGFGLGTAPEMGPDLAAYDGLPGSDAA